MPESNWRQQHSPSPKSTVSMQPPLSKFYHGPVTGWNSAESSPGPEGTLLPTQTFGGSLLNQGAGTTFNPNPVHDFAPPPAPQDVSGPSIHGSLQMSHGWHPHVPPAPASNQWTSASYRSSNYAVNTDANDAPINPTWESGPPDTSTWGVNYNQKYSHVPGPVIKPPLPVCTLLCEREHHNHSVSDSRIPAAKELSTSRTRYFLRIQTPSFP